MERYVAVDNVCAWPALARLPGGDIVAAIHNRPSHAGLAGDVEVWGTEDGGRFWKLRGVAAAHEPGTNRMNVACGLAANGDLLVLSSGWSNKAENAGEPQPRPGERPQILPSWACRSSDGGRTWRRGPAMDDAAKQVHPIPFGLVSATADGQLGASFYESNRCVIAQGEPIRVSAWFCRSKDDGRTWVKASLIGADAYCETATLRVEGGRWLAASRTYPLGRLDLFVSEDDGATWSPRGPLTCDGQHPAHLLRLADGRVLLTYGVRHSGLFGLGARLSADGGQTWGRPIVILDFGPSATDGGYPSSVQLASGSVLTAYYANATDAHTRFHMGVMIWDVDEADKVNRRK